MMGNAKETVDIDAIANRLSGAGASSIWIYHPTINPCACGGCNPTAHPAHPLHADLVVARNDLLALAAEVKRLRPFAERFNGDSALRSTGRTSRMLRDVLIDALSMPPTGRRFFVIAHAEHYAAELRAQTGRLAKAFNVVHVMNYIEFLSVERAAQRLSPYANGNTRVYVDHFAYEWGCLERGRTGGRTGAYLLGLDLVEGLRAKGGT